MKAFWIALGVCLLLAVPSEYLARGSYVFRGGTATLSLLVLNLGPFVQALFCPLALWLLSLGLKQSRTDPSRMAARRWPLVLLGIGVAQGVAWLWSWGVSESFGHPDNWNRTYATSYYAWFSALSSLSIGAFAA